MAKKKNSKLISVIFFAVNFLAACGDVDQDSERIGHSSDLVANAYFEENSLVLNPNVVSKDIPNPILTYVYYGSLSSHYPQGEAIVSSDTSYNDYIGLVRFVPLSGLDGNNIATATIILNPNNCVKSPAAGTCFQDPNYTLPAGYGNLQYSNPLAMWDPNTATANKASTSLNWYYPDIVGRGATSFTPTAASSTASTSLDVTADAKNYYKIGGLNYGWVFAVVQPVPSGYKAAYRPQDMLLRVTCNPNAVCPSGVYGNQTVSDGCMGTVVTNCGVPACPPGWCGPYTASGVTVICGVNPQGTYPDYPGATCPPGTGYCSGAQGPCHYEVVKHCSDASLVNNTNCYNDVNPPSPEGPANHCTCG